MKRKSKLQIKELPIKEVTEFNGLSPSMIHKWREIKEDENGLKFRPATGKHNLAKSSFLSTYFYKYGDEEPYPLYETALNRLDVVKGHILKHCKDEEVLEDIEFLKEIFEKIKEIDDKI
jgi:hypothetical protein